MSAELKEKELENLRGSLDAVYVCEDVLQDQQLTVGNYQRYTGTIGWLHSMKKQLIQRIDEIRAELNPNVAPQVTND